MSRATVWIVTVALVVVGARTAAAQCGTDVDCKGDRVCDAGVCVSPSASVPAPAPSPVPATAIPAPAAPAPPPRVSPTDVTTPEPGAVLTASHEVVPGHQGFYIGASVGFGSLGGSGGGEREAAPSFVFRNGGAFSEKFLLGYEVGLWGKPLENEDWTGFFGLALVGTYYLVVSDNLDVFLRGGLGVAAYVYALYAEDSPPREEFIIQEGGFMTQFGGGVEKRLSKRFAMGGSLDFHYAAVADAFSLNFIATTVMVSWY
jgi:hypothetical protein